MPLQATSGAASYDAFGGGVPVVPNYIEDVFSTYLYTGNGSTQTITNGIDLAGEGGLVWIKDRTQTWDNLLVDSARGNGNALFSNTTSASTAGYGVDLASNGFNLTSGDNISNKVRPYVSWTFREQPKFFDIVTYTGDGIAGRTVAHNLGAVPGCIIVKCVTQSENWYVYHQALGNTQTLVLNQSAAQGTDPSWNNTTPTSTVFTVGSNSQVNFSGRTYVAYLFAHNAGGFGLTGTDNVISCGSISAPNYTQVLGWEPQFVLMKRADSVGDWFMFDSMRGLTADGGTTDKILYANTSGAETTSVQGIELNSTGFRYGFSNEMIYIAIRRGPMKVPTLGTSVFNALSRTGTAATATVSTTILPDLVMSQARGGMFNVFYDRLRGAGATLSPNLGTDAESVVTNGITAFNNTSYTVGTDASQNRINWNTFTYANWLFSRAPGFFDEVCYTGNGSTQTITHNLGAVPELIIGKNRTTAGNNWPVLFNFASTNMSYAFLNQTGAGGNDTYANVGVFSAAPTSTSMFLTNSGSMNTNTNGHVAYLFATCAGVSKVFSYTGNGSSQTINCGFTAGSRWVMIKRTDSTGDWYVWDSARGIVAGNDPHLSLNTTAAEVTTDDSVDTDNTGFIVNQVAATNVNVSSATYIGIAIA